MRDPGGQGSMHGVDRGRGSALQVMPREARSAALGARLALVVLLALSTACGSSGDADSDRGPNIRAGQITRPAGAGLPLDDPGALQAYSRAEQFLIDWLFRHDIEAALSHFSSDLRPANQPLLDDTRIDGECLLTQVEGSRPDTDGAVLARYEIRECEITPPDAPAASYIKVIITLTDQSAWITGVELE